MGRGGFAVVYRAWQPAFSRHVAIKVLSATVDPGGVERFERECRAIGSLSGHPNVVTVYEMGLTGDGRPFISMEYLPGGSLGERMAFTGPLAWPQVLEVGVRLAGALAWAHGRKVLHRDVKPDNVLVSRFGEHKLADFGIARVQGGPETQTGVVTASFAYAAPEVLSAQGPTELSDVYSLGATIFALVVGRAPFVRLDEPSLLPLLARIAGEAVPDLRPQGVPGAVCQVIETALSKDPVQRPPSAEALGRRLQDAQAAAGLAVTHLPLEADRDTTEAAAFTVRIPAEQLPNPVEQLPNPVEFEEPTVPDPRPKEPTEVLGAAPPTEKPSPDPAPRRRGQRVRPLVAALVVLVAAVVGTAVLLGGGDGDGKEEAGPGTSIAPGPTSTTAPLPFLQDDFSNPSTGWARSDTPDYVTEFANGQYRMLLRKVRIGLPRLPRSTGTGFGDVRVEVDARTLSEVPHEFGVVCRYGGTGQPYYEGRISPSGFWVVARQVSGGQRTTLATGSTTFKVSGQVPQDRLYRVALECTGTNPTSLRLYVNDVKVGETVDREGIPAGNVGVIAATSDVEPVEVVFDNFMARRPT